MASDNRTPNWTCIVYEDSLPEDYISQLESTTLEIYISPWHDKDVWTKGDELKNPKHVAGKPKKKHKHVIICYGKGNKKSLEQVKEDFAFLNGTAFKKVKSLIGMVQYLDHRYCRTKVHYDPNDVVALNGAEYDELVNTPTDSQSRLLLKEIRLYCRCNDIYDFCDLQDAVDDDETLLTWSKVIDQNQFKLANYITSRRCKRNDALKQLNATPNQLIKRAMQSGSKEEEPSEE